jgi:hypothetical protein
MIEMKIETIAAVRERQPVWLDQYEKACAGLAETDLVRTCTRVTPFGRYLLNIQCIDD